MERIIHHIDTAGPKKDGLGRVVFDHAREIPYIEGANRWQQRIKEIELAGGNSSHQVVVIPRNSLTEKLSRLDCSQLANQNPITTTKMNTFPDNEDLPRTENEIPGIKHLTIISSAINYADLFHIMQVATHYKEALGTEHVTLFAPFLTTTRQDKNTDSKTGEYEPVPINVHVTMAALSTCVDGFIVISPHSFATQTATARIGKPLLPITPWKYLMDTVLGREIYLNGKSTILTPENTINVRPDEGRNIAALRISKNYDLEHVSFSKRRLTPTETELSLPSGDQLKVTGKLCVVYDDEFNTVETLSKIATKVGEYGALGVVAIGDHGKFTGDWEKHVKNPVIKKIFITDSRSPVGNIKPFIDSGKIEVISLQNLIISILLADAEGVNFWTDPKYNHMVLQTNGQDEGC